MGKRKRYSATYKEKRFFMFALCEEEVFWRVLAKCGVFYSPTKAYDIVSENKVEIVAL